MNTDQAFELLKDAGVAEDVGIQTVRRWLLERKVKYESIKQTITGGYILEDTDQAFQLLMDAGVATSIGIQTVKRWLREGKIQNVGNGNELTEYLSHETPSRRFQQNSSNQEKTIKQLKLKIKGQEEHIKGIEALHQSSINTLLQQKNQLKQEIIRLENEKKDLQREAGKLAKDNLDLSKELLKLKEELAKGNNSGSDKTRLNPPKPLYEDRQKLGLSKSASNKEVLARYKKLLKLTHPDHGGNEIMFHYIKTDYDYFRVRMKDD